LLKISKQLHLIPHIRYLSIRMLLPFISLYSLLALFRQSVPAIILIIMAVSRALLVKFFALFMIAAAMQLEPSIP
jgi:hypothetical protein